MSEPEPLRAHAERIRASGLLGRSPLMQRLFDFLLECSIAGKAPKEIEVAVDAFGKGAEFDVSQDAMVRVYIHKLRRKLEEFYAGPGAAEPVRLSIPKGEYRFFIEAAASEAPAETATSGSAAAGSSSSGSQHAESLTGGSSTLGAPGAGSSPAASPIRRLLQAPRRKWLLTVLIASLAINAIVLDAIFLPPPPARDEYQSVRESSVWAPVLEGDRPIFLVVGDYYIFGETDGTFEVKRLVREFDINSPQDLNMRLKTEPELADKYMDMELAYLPTATAYALREVMPVLAPANRRVRVVTMSQLNPAVIKSANVVYLGFLSGLGMLSDLVFASSRLQVGDTFDEILDRTTNQRYISQEAGASIRGERNFHDYGYFATFEGPSGNHIVVIAGTRDVAAMHMAETLTSPKGVASLTAASGKSTEFEALYEVYGMDKLNLDGKLLLTSPIDSTVIWMGEPGKRNAMRGTSAATDPTGPPAESIAGK